MLQLDRIALINKIESLVTTNNQNLVSGAVLRDVLVSMAHSANNAIDEPPQQLVVGTADQVETYMDANLLTIN